MTEHSETEAQKSQRHYSISFIVLVISFLSLVTLYFGSTPLRVMVHHQGFLNSSGQLRLFFWNRLNSDKDAVTPILIRKYFEDDRFDEQLTALPAEEEGISEDLSFRVEKLDRKSVTEVYRDFVSQPPQSQYSKLNDLSFDRLKYVEFLFQRIEEGPEAEKLEALAIIRYRILENRGRKVKFAEDSKRESQFQSRFAAALKQLLKALNSKSEPALSALLALDLKLFQRYGTTEVYYPESYSLVTEAFETQWSRQLKREQHSLDLQLAPFLMTKDPEFIFLNEIFTPAQLWRLRRLRDCSAKVRLFELGLRQQPPELWFPPKILHANGVSAESNWNISQQFLEQGEIQLTTAELSKINVHFQEISSRLGSQQGAPQAGSLLTKLQKKLQFPRLLQRNSKPMAVNELIAELKQGVFENKVPCLKTMLRQSLSASDYEQLFAEGVKELLQPGKMPVWDFLNEDGQQGIYPLALSSGAPRAIERSFVNDVVCRLEYFRSAKGRQAYCQYMQQLPDPEAFDLALKLTQTEVNFGQIFLARKSLATKLSETQSQQLTQLIMARRKINDAKTRVLTRFKQQESSTIATGVKEEKPKNLRSRLKERILKGPVSTLKSVESLWDLHKIAETDWLEAIDLLDLLIQKARESKTSSTESSLSTTSSSKASRRSGQMNFRLDFSANYGRVLEQVLALVPDTDQAFVRLHKFIQHYPEFFASLRLLSHCRERACKLYQKLDLSKYGLILQSGVWLDLSGQLPENLEEAGELTMTIFGPYFESYATTATNYPFRKKYLKQYCLSFNLTGVELEMFEPVFEDDADIRRHYFQDCCKVQSRNRGIVVEDLQIFLRHPEFANEFLAVVMSQRDSQAKILGLGWLAKLNVAAHSIRSELATWASNQLHSQDLELFAATLYALVAVDRSGVTAIDLLHTIVVNQNVSYLHRALALCALRRYFNQPEAMKRLEQTVPKLAGSLKAQAQRSIAYMHWRNSLQN